MALPPAPTEAEAPLPPEQHPGGLGALSDDELKQQYAKAQNPLAGMSDEELTRAYHQSNPTGSQGYPLSGPNWDEYMKTSPVGHVLNAFGQGAKQGWGTDDIGMSPEISDALKQAGVFNDVTKDQHSVIRSLNEAVMRPAAAALDVAIRGGQALASGGLAALQSGAQELPNVSPVTGEGYVKESLASLLNPRQAGEAAVQGIEARILGAPEFGGLPVPPNLPAAVAAKIIPGGDGTYFGYTNPVHGVMDGTGALVDDAKKSVANENAPGETPYSYSPAAVGGTSGEAPIQPYAPHYEAPAPTDIHEAARQVDPETFGKYDTLSVQAEDLRDRISQASEENRTAAAAQAPHAAEIEDLNNKLASEPTPRLAKKYAARIAELQPEHDAFLESDQHAMLTRDTDQVSDMRQELQKLDYQMRDLAPQVTAAYREAGRQFPELTEGASQTPETSEPTTTTAAAKGPGLETETATGEAGRPVVTPPNEGVKPPSATPAAATQPENAPARIIPANAIMQDVSSKLQAAGRPAEEADAAAAVVQARYEARAQAFGGAKGSAHELYEREGPAIQGAEKGRMGVNGQTSIKDGQTIVTLFKRADASTFLHEMGHHWLEEINGDAKDDAATPQMKSDWEAVRNYLKQPDDGIITRRAHEKFARGFERYMMEGVAPTRALDGVFAKFKDWLTTIYQSVNKLRSPITADIRDVFDRMLGKGTEPATITPEAPHIPEAYEPPKPTPAAGLTRDLASLHETDAETTPPQFADQVADQIRDEREETIAKQVPDVRPTDESTAGAGAEAGGGEQRSGEAGQAEPATGGGRGNVAEPEAERPGGSQVTDKGVSAYESAEPNERPTAASQRYTRPDTRLVDKAGNIRLDNLQVAEDVKDAIRQSAEENGGYMTARRGVMSDQEMLDLSDALGMNASSLSARKLGQAFNAEQTTAAYKLLIQSATTVRDAMVKAASGDDAAVLDYSNAKDRHRMIQEQVAGITAEAGRSLRAHGAAKELLANAGLSDVDKMVKDTVGQTLFQLRAEAKLGASLQTPMQISKFINDSKKPSFTDMLLEYWVNGLISGPATHTTYTVGNSALALWKAVPETAIQASIGTARRALGTTEPTVRWGEVGAQLYSLMGKGAVDGLKAGYQALKEGQTQALPHESVDAMSPGQFRAYQAEIAKGVSHEDAIKNILGISANQPAYFALSPKPGAIPNFNVGGVPIPLGSVVRTPSTVVGAIHSVFRMMGYEQSIAAQAYRTASEEGLYGQAFNQRVAQLTTDSPEAMMTQARAEATQQTLMGRGGPLTQAVANLTDKAPALKFIMPFVKIGSNIMSQAFLERTPIGALYPDIRANLMGRNGAIARDAQISRMVGGVSVIGAIGALAMEGKSTGAGPQEPNARSLWLAAGNQPYSIRVGNTWYGIHRLGPLALLAGMGADMYELGHAMDTQQSDKVASIMLGMLSKGVLDETWMRGPSEAMDAAFHPEEYGGKWVRDEVSSFVPFSVGMSQMARATDPYQRQARTILDAARAKIPGESQTLMPRYDIFGRPIPNSDVLGVAGLSAIYKTQMSNDPVFRSMLHLGVTPAQPKRDIRGVQLTDQQYELFQQQAGKMLKMRLDVMVNNPRFSAQPEGVQAKMMRETVEDSRKRAANIVMAQVSAAHGRLGPDIIQQAQKNKHDIVMSGHPEKAIDMPDYSE